MKNKLFSLLFLLSVLFVSNVIFAQSKLPDKRVKVNFNAGMSVIGSWMNFIDVTQPGIVEKSYSTPVAQFSFEYAFDRWFGLAVSGAYQYYYLDLLPINQGEEILSANIHRLNVGIRPKIYFLRQESVNIYSAFRVSYTFWNIRLNTSMLIDYVERLLPRMAEDFIMPRIPIVEKYSFITRFFAMQVTLVGADFWFTDSFGLNGEIAFGSPYFLNIGISYRF